MANPFVPVPAPEPQPFWDGIADRTVRLTKCVDCGEVFFPPSPVCPNCTSKRIEWFDSSGRGTLYSYVIQQKPLQWWGEGPRSVAIVELEEGPRLISSIVGCPQTPEALQLDMAVQATFVDFDGSTVLCFEPEGSIHETR